MQEQGRRRFTLVLFGCCFAPRLAASIAVMLPLMLLAGLGFWQLERAAQKQALLDDIASQGEDRPLNSLPAELDPPVWRFRRVALGGHFDTAHTLYLDNRIHQGAAGYHLLTPLRLDDGRGVLVNRGWARLGPTRDILPPAPRRDGRLIVSGQLDTAPGVGIRLGNDGPESRGWPRVVQRIDLAVLGNDLGYPLLPLLLLEDDNGDAELVREWRPVVFGPERHVGYAVQWFGLALALLIIYIAAYTRRSNRDK